MEWIGTLPFKGQHRCLDTGNYRSSLETHLDLFQFATSFYKDVKGVKQIVWFTSPLLYPIARGGGALERILEAKLLTPIYAKP